MSLSCFNEEMGRFDRDIKVTKSYKIIKMINMKGAITKIKTTSKIGFKAYCKWWEIDSVDLKTVKIHST